MSDDDVFNEPVSTGQIQTVLGGDVALAKTYQREARRMMGQMRLNHGVNDRMAAGEPGGFFRNSKTMPDGTRIEVITNNGRDLIKIETKREEKYSTTSTTAEGSEERPTASVTHKTETVTHKDKPHHEDLTRKREDSEEEEEEKEEFSPYMWVGIRVKQEVASFNERDTSIPLSGILTYMVEPSVEGVARGCVVNSNQVSWWVNMEADLDAIPPPPDLPPLDPPSIDEGLANFKDFWSYLSSFPSHLHNLLFVDTSDSGGNAGFAFSANGLRCYDQFNRELFNADMTPTENVMQFAPYDPELPEDEQDGLSAEPPLRTYGPGFEQHYYDSRIPDGHRAWDVCYVLDPQEAEAIDPYDPRDRVNLARRILENAGMAASQAVVLPGEYVLHLGAYGDNTLKSSRAGDRNGLIDGTWGGLSTDYFWPLDITDMGDYLYTLYQPMELEVEVRLRKSPETVKFNYNITIQNYAVSGANTMPGGTPTITGDGCPYGGPNKHGPNWGDSIVIDVLGGTSRLGFQDDAGVFGASNFDTEPDNRRGGTDLYIYTGAGIDANEPLEDMWQYHGRMIYRWLLQAVTGYWGYGYDLRETSPSSIEQKLRASNFGKPGVYAPIFVFRPDTGEFAELPVIPMTDADRPPGYETPPPNTPPTPTPDGWVWYETLEWFYPHSYISKAACRVPHWYVCVGPQTGTGQFGQYGDPVVTCC